MAATLELGGIRIAVVRKSIRNLHLSVYPPDGVVRVAAPRWMAEEAIRLFAIGKLGWIKRQQRKMREQEREAPREYLERESHFVWGQRYLLQIIERDAAPLVELRHRKLVLRVRPGTPADQREAIVQGWYRNQLRAAVSALLATWEPRVGHKVERVFVQRMKTKWGSCNRRSRHIRINTELAKKPPDCLEYIVLHELAHLREPTHDDGFRALMDRLMPSWRDRKESLNALPVRRESWRHC